MEFKPEKILLCTTPLLPHLSQIEVGVAYSRDVVHMEDIISHFLGGKLVVLQVNSDIPIDSNRRQFPVI